MPGGASSAPGATDLEPPRARIRAGRFTTLKRQALQLRPPALRRGTDTRRQAPSKLRRRQAGGQTTRRSCSAAQLGPAIGRIYLSNETPACAFRPGWQPLCHFARDQGCQPDWRDRRLTSACPAAGDADGFLLTYQRGYASSFVWEVAHLPRQSVGTPFQRVRHPGGAHFHGPLKAWRPPRSGLPGLTPWRVTSRPRHQATMLRRHLTASGRQ